MKHDRFLGAIIFVLGIVGIVLASQLHVKTFANDPGPGVFPLIASVILVISGAGIFLTKQLEHKKDGKPFLSKDGWKRAGIMTGALIIYALAMRVLGFYISTPILTYVFYYLIAGKQKAKPVKGIIYSLVTFVVVYLVFKVMLNSFLPPGMLF